MNYIGLALFTFFVSCLVVPMFRGGYSLRKGFWIGLVAAALILGYGMWT